MCTCKNESLITYTKIHFDLGIQQHDKNANALFSSIINDIFKFSLYFYDAFHLQFKITQKVKLPPENTILSGLTHLK